MHTSSFAARSINPDAARHSSPARLNSEAQNSSARHCHPADVDHDGSIPGEFKRPSSLLTGCIHGTKVSVLARKSENARREPLASDPNGRLSPSDITKLCMPLLQWDDLCCAGSKMPTFHATLCAAI